nr:MAG TPA: hypothetical protein [Caudoviricetes sp.]
MIMTKILQNCNKYFTNVTEIFLQLLLYLQYTFLSICDIIYIGQDIICYCYIVVYILYLYNIIIL